MIRRNHQRCFIEKSVLENFKKLTGKPDSEPEPFFNKVATLLKIVSGTGAAKFLRTPFL